MSFQERILSSAPRHEHLLKSLDETSSAAAAVQQTESYISRLESQIATETKNIEKISWRVSKERSEYEEHRDTHLHRLAHKLIGKSHDFAAKTDKEEREYHDVLEAQTKAATNLENLKANLEDAQRKLPALQEASANHESYQSELGQLYESIFSAPHPPFLTLDIATSLLSRAQSARAASTKPYDAAIQAVQLLSDTQRHLGFALNNVTTALSTWRIELLPKYNNFAFENLNGGGAGGGAHIVERNAMAMAQSEASQAESLLAQTRRLDPSSGRNISPIQLANPDFLISCGAAISTSSGSRRSSIRPVQFNAFRFKEKMDVAERDLKRVIAEVAREMGMVRERLQRLKREVDEAGERVEEAEREVRRAREEIFQRVVDGEDVGGEEGGMMGGGLFGELQLEPLHSYAP